MTSRVIRKSLRAALAALLILSLWTSPSFAEDDDAGPSTDMMALDLIFFRPLRLITFLAGSVAFMATMPLPYIFGGDEVIDDARSRAFTEPASALFETPLGDL